jgi:hypothetical protein
MQKSDQFYCFNSALYNWVDVNLPVTQRLSNGGPTLDLSGSIFICAVFPSNYSRQSNSRSTIHSSRRLNRGEAVYLHTCALPKMRPPRLHLRSLSFYVLSIVEHAHYVSFFQCRRNLGGWVNEPWLSNISDPANDSSSSSLHVLQAP